MIFPSLNSMIRSPNSSAPALSCVTTITVFCKEISFNNSYSSRPVSLSNAPVGSSARMILGFFISDRAIATRCFCPPDNSLTYLPYSVSPSSSTSPILRNNTSTSPRSAFLPSNSIAKVILNPTVWFSIRLYSWKTNPTHEFR